MSGYRQGWDECRALIAASIRKSCDKAPDKLTRDPHEPCHVTLQGFRAFADLIERLEPDGSELSIGVCALERP